MKEARGISACSILGETQDDDGFLTLTEKVYRTLREEITSGELKPGTRLVRRSVSKRLGVSPIPVTEALYRLEQDGLVDSEAKYGSRVRVWTLDALRNEQVLREALECQAARLCAEKATDAQLSEFAGQAKRLDALMEKLDPVSTEGMKAHLELHVSIARITGYELIEREIRRVWLRWLVRWNWISAALHPVPPDWHQQLIAAIATRDGSKASEKMRDHVRRNQEHDLELLRELQQKESVTR